MTSVYWGNVLDVVGLTNFEGILTIEGSDWTDTDLRPAQVCQYNISIVFNA